MSDRLHVLISQVIGEGNHLVSWSDQAAYTNLSDDRIHGVQITRGGNSPSSAVSPTVCELETSSGRLRDKVTGQSCSLKLTSIASKRLGDHLNVPAEAIQARFTGRMATNVINDRGTSRTSSTTITASSWTAQARTSTATTTPAKDTGVHRAVMHAWRNTRAGDYAPITAEGEAFGVLAATEEKPLRWREIEQKYVSDIGLCLRHLRNGHVQLVGNDYRAAQMRRAAESTAPVIRAQGLAPATWGLYTEVSATRIRARYTTSTGGTGEQVANVDVGDLDKDIEDVDWTHVRVPRWGGSHLQLAAQARAHQTSTRIYQLPSLKIDLLRLITSQNRYHRRVAGQLLVLEEGGPVFLSGDWLEELEGAHIAHGITEEITPDGWYMTLSMSPVRQVIGVESPTIRPLTWDSARKPWDTTAATWNGGNI